MENDVLVKPKNEKTYTLTNPSRYFFRFFEDSLYSVQVPFSDGSIIEPGEVKMISEGLNPYQYRPIDIPDKAYLHVTDCHDDYELYECYSWAETVICESAAEPIDTFFIPWTWVSPDEDR